METARLKRSMAISFIDDPYLAILFKRIYDKNIKGEVDELNIAINGENIEIVEFIKNLWKDEATNILMKYTKGETVAHGEALNKLYAISKGDIFITLDSDNFIYRKGIIDRYCTAIDNGVDYVGSFSPFMSFFRKSVLDKIDEVDFRDFHTKKENGTDKFYDTMKRLMIKFSEISKLLYEIPIDNLPEYEHIGRMSAFPIYVEDCYFDRDTGLQRFVRKLFGRANRVALIKYIFDVTKDEYPDKKYNEFYWKTFQDVIEDVGHKEKILNEIIEEKIRPKFKDYE